MRYPCISPLTLSLLLLFFQKECK
uniref:Uncharacterized protein n=1 Tax=Rhizophora mucronata TaxID=61149 RepID=A0A2P2R0R3_RHIMU